MFDVMEATTTTLKVYNSRFSYKTYIANSDYWGFDEKFINL